MKTIFPSKKSICLHNLSELHIMIFFQKAQHGKNFKKNKYIIVKPGK